MNFLVANQKLLGAILKYVDEKLDKPQMAN